MVNLSSPLSSLIPTLDAVVLEVLAGTESSLGVSQVQRLARRGARSGMHRVLDRLVGQGLVIADRTNMGFVYRLNREHLLASAVLSAAGARARFKDQLAQACADLEPTVSCAALFGSVARGEGGPDSDIDLLLVVTDDSVLTDAWDAQLRMLEDRVLAWTGNRLESVVLTEIELLRAFARNEPVTASWRADAVTVTGTPLSNLLAARRP